MFVKSIKIHPTSPKLYKIDIVFCCLFYSHNIGASRGFAFVEFSTEEEATRWMEYKQVS